MRRYFREYGLVELQATFYRIIKIETARKWRESAPPKFIFTVKAFQGITHEATSPTWRRSNIRPTDRHGGLKPTEEVLACWKYTKAICEALKAPFCLVQTPPNFKDTSENIKNALSFFSMIDRGQFEIGLEARGWRSETIFKVCEEAGLVHVTDPFLQDPLTLGIRDTVYLRLHGSPPGKRMYRYTFTDDDLRMLVGKVKEYNADRIYVLFNNITMLQDSKRFMGMIKDP